MDTHELRSVGVLARVSHRENARPGVAELAIDKEVTVRRVVSYSILRGLNVQVLVRELLTIDRLEKMVQKNPAAYFGVALHTFPPVPSPRAITETSTPASTAKRLATRTEVTTLNHEVFDDTVELGTLVAKAFAKRSAILLHAGSEGTEVLSGLGNTLPRTFVSEGKPWRSSNLTYAAEQTNNNCEPVSTLVTELRKLVRNSLRPIGSPPCSMSKKTLLVIFGPLTASADCAKKSAERVTTMKATLIRPNMVE